MKLPRDLSGAQLAKALARVGTLAAILADVAAHQEISRDELLEKLFG
jgi:hypothetical protein